MKSSLGRETENRREAGRTNRGVGGKSIRREGGSAQRKAEGQKSRFLRLQDNPNRCHQAAIPTSSDPTEPISSSEWLGRRCESSPSSTSSLHPCEAYWIYPLLFGVCKGRNRVSQLMLESEMLGREGRGYLGALFSSRFK